MAAPQWSRMLQTITKIRCLGIPTLLPIWPVWSTTNNIFTCLVNHKQYFHLFWFLGNLFPPQKSTMVWCKSKVGTRLTSADWFRSIIPCSGLLVSRLAFYSDDTSSNHTYFYCFSNAIMNQPTTSLNESTIFYTCLKRVKLLNEKESEIGP